MATALQSIQLTLWFIVVSNILHVVALNASYSFIWYIVFPLLDLDECISDPCHAMAVCTNFPGGYSCFCQSGYTGNGSSCAGRSKIIIIFIIEIY